jgi:predicted RNase H-like nuclease (RuvC/YqgF family)
MDAKKVCRDELLKLAKEKKIYLEGNILKVLSADAGDTEFIEYLKTCKDRDVDSRRKRLQVTKQVQKQNKDLESAAKENVRVNKQLEKALDEAITSAEHATKSKEEAELAKEESERLRIKAEQAQELAETDLSILQKKTQTELMGSIVRVALWVIMGVGLITTALYIFVLALGHDSKIIESTWSNLFGILLTNSFSIIGTIMGVKHASNIDKK